MASRWCEIAKRRNHSVPNCDSVKKARDWLDRAGIAYAFHDYKKRGADADRIAGWAEQAGWEKVLNRAGTTFKKLPDADKDSITEKKAIALMLAQPSIIKRPVLEAKSKLTVGFKPDDYRKLFD